MLPFKLNKFDTRWDLHQMFHEQYPIYNPVLTLFGNGAVAVYAIDGRPSLREIYPRLGVQLVNSKDVDCPPLYLDSECREVVPRAWLNTGGSRDLLVDLTTSQVWGLDASIPREALPAWADRTLPRRVRAFFQSVDADPVATPIELSVPASLTKQERKHLRDVRTQCCGWYALQTEDYRSQLSRHTPWMTAPHRINQAQIKRISFLEGDPDWMATQRLRYTVHSWEKQANLELLECWRRRIAVHGFSISRATYAVDCLYVKPK